MTTGPTIKRGSSNQSYQTPKDFVDAVKARFGPLDIDLAASAGNAQCEKFITKEQDSLAPWCQWHCDDNGNHLPHRLCWLNPPFDKIEPWAQKCAAESALGARILLLTPASIGANWFKQWVQPSAVVIGLNGRIHFDPTNPKWGYPKDCCLSVFWGGLTGFQTWTWK